MRLRFTEQRSTGIAIALAAAFVLAWTAPRAEAAEKLTQKTRQAWETYEKLTEKRIFETELKDTSRFLHLDFMTAPESRKAREVLKSGNVHVQKMTTLDDKGKPIPADDACSITGMARSFSPASRWTRCCGGSRTTTRPQSISKR